jgi:hypothetical protein
MEAIQDVLDELETVYDNVSKNARDHIHSEWVILREFLCSRSDNIFAAKSSWPSGNQGQSRLS